MEITSQKDFLKSRVRTWQKEGKSIGFVPTMGALHEGHLSLIRTAGQQCDVVVSSIFVNPLQFNSLHDLERYPRTLESDLQQLKKETVDLVFTPEPSAFYVEKPLISLDFGLVSSDLEGKFRPGHFSGVGIVVSRLFHLVQPNKAFFGAKDLQQCAVIQTMVQDLGFEVEIVRCPTLREKSGLAMSSRNALLSPEGRETAALIYESLRLANEVRPQLGIPASESVARAFLKKHPEIELEYLAWVKTSNLQVVKNETPEQEIALCIAARIEGVRLIDNLIV